MSIWAWTCLASATSASASREITAWGASKCSNDFVGTVQRLAHAIIHIYVDIVSQSSSKIDPLAPFRVVHWKRGLGTLFSGQDGEKSFGCLPHWFGGNAGGTNRKKTVLHVAVRCDSFEWFSQAFALELRRHFAISLSSLGRALGKSRPGNQRGETRHQRQASLQWINHSANSITAGLTTRCAIMRGDRP